MGRGQGLAPPLLYAWEARVATPAEEDIGQANRAAMLQLARYTSEWERPRLLLAVRSYRSTVMYDPTQTRVVIALRGEFEEGRGTILATMLQISGECNERRAPPGGFERAIQRVLEGDWGVPMWARGLDRIVALRSVPIPAVALQPCGPAASAQCVPARAPLRERLSDSYAGWQTAGGSLVRIRSKFGRGRTNLARFRPSLVDVRRNRADAG